MAHSRTYIRLMNSREWKELRIRKLQADPLCERCKTLHGWFVPARCIHHIQPVESGRTDAECREICLRYSNLQSLCFQCHREIHQAEGYHKSDVVKERNEQRHAAWIDNMENRFK